MSKKIQAFSDYVDQTFKSIDMDHVRVKDSTFSDCRFENSSFVEAVFEDCRFVNCIFEACDLSLIQVPKCEFSEVHFKNSKAMGIDWTQAFWPVARLRNPLLFSGCSISHATFIGLSLRGLKIIDCIAMDVDFREAILSQADFSGSDLSGCLFSNTTLSKADFSRARNYSIHPTQNIITDAVFSLPEAMSLLYNMDIVLRQI